MYDVCGGEVVAALRVHAVSGRNWCWVLPVWLHGMVPVGTNIERARKLGRANNRGPEAPIVVYNDPARYVLVDASTPNVVAIVTRVSVVISDILAQSHDRHVPKWIISLLNIVDLIVNIIGISSSGSFGIDITF
ncbi:predicted protein [Postia placenta Mad-698-R]|nr:predicted protein [Postia placenta Mad-698-R]